MLHWYDIHYYLNMCFCSIEFKDMFSSCYVTCWDIVGNSINSLISTRLHWCSSYYSCYYIILWFLVMFYTVTISFPVYWFPFVWIFYELILVLSIAIKAFRLWSSRSKDNHSNLCTVALVLVIGRIRWYWFLIVKHFYDILCQKCS